MSNRPEISKWYWEDFTTFVKISTVPFHHNIMSLHYSCNLHPCWMLEHIADSVYTMIWKSFGCIILFIEKLEVVYIFVHKLEDCYIMTFFSLTYFMYTVPLHILDLKSLMLFFIYLARPMYCCALNTFWTFLPSLCCLCTS